ncbi:MAG: 4Fe-4S binding protein [Candidatus Woesearchaeota archaeon]
MPKVTIDYTKCNLSKVCIDICPVGVFEIKNNKMIAARQEDCTVCRACESGCPKGAIKVEE